MSRVAQRPAWYALERGGWRDYVSLLHPPYTAWHLSYVVIGGCLAPVVAWDRLAAAVTAFALAVGIGAHALDELKGHPLRTRIPDRVLVVLAAVSVAGACGIGVAGALLFKAWLALLIPLGVFLVVAYNLELAGGLFHSDLWFGLAWGGFPVLNGYAAVAGTIDFVSLSAAAFAVLLSLAQRALSSHVRFVRRGVAEVEGFLELSDGVRQRLDAARLTGAAESALRLLTLATVVLAAALILFRL
jgi:heme O synthase-like polyprenyltransferase